MGLTKAEMNTCKGLPTGVLVFCLLMGVYLLTFSGMGVTDDEQLFAVLSGQLADGNAPGTMALFGNDRLRGSSANIEPLHPLLGVPWYLLAKAAGWGRVQVLHLPNGVYTALCAALLAVIALRRGYCRASAVTLAVSFGLGTIAFPYARSNFRETLAMLCLTGAFACLDYLRREGLPFWKYSGLMTGMTMSVGLAALTKVTCGLCLPFYVIAAWLHLKHNAGQSNRGLAAILGIWLLVCLGATGTIFTWMPELFSGRFSLDFIASMLKTITRIPHDDFWPALAGMLVSPGKGLLFYSPVLILAFIATGSLRQTQTSVNGTLSTSKSTNPLVEMIRSDRLVAFGSLWILMVMQALIYDQEWWGITWGTRALLPALPLLMLVCLPALDAGLNNSRKNIRSFTGLLPAAGLLIQLGRILVPDPAYAGWLVRTSGANISAASQWDFSRMPLWRHWQLAFQGISTDIVWVHLSPDSHYFGLGLIIVIGLLVGLCACLLFRHKKIRPLTISMLLIITACLLPASLSIAKSDQRYYGENIDYQSACRWLSENAGNDSLLLIDAYLKPMWWYSFNFGCANLPWVGLPYEHAKAYSGDLYYPRLRELSVRVKEQQAHGLGIYLLESRSSSAPAYHLALDEQDFQAIQLNQVELTANPDITLFELR
jgi:hypothetical protein